MTIENLENDNWVIMTLTYKSQIYRSFEYSFQFRIWSLSANTITHVAISALVAIRMAENVWRNNDLTFISIVVESVSWDCELHSLVSPWDNWCISLYRTEISSFRALSIGQTWLSQACPAFRARLIYDRVTGSFRVRAARNSTPFDMTSCLFSHVRIEHSLFFA